MDKRFMAMEKRFVEMDARMDSHFADFRLEVRGETGELRGILRLHSWMLALLVAGVLLPVVERLAALL